MALNDLKYETIIQKAESIAESLYNSRKDLDTQLRKFYGYLLEFQRNVESKVTDKHQRIDRLPLLKAKVAYLVARNNRLVPLVQQLEPWLNKAEGIEDLEKIIRFMEGVISFYKYIPIKRRGGR